MTFRTIALVVAATAAIAAPAAADQDLRSPDARDAAIRAAGRTVDLRSPDTRDPYSGVPVTVLTSEPVVDRVDTGFDWADAAIGAAAVFTLVMVVVAGVAFMRPNDAARATRARSA
jgi:hypothetical protein